MAMLPGSILCCAVWLSLLAGAVGENMPPLLSQGECGQANVARPDFSATQIAYLVSELQQSISPGCYSVVSNSLAVCLPDLSLSSGCCTPDCARSVRLASVDARHLVLRPRVSRISCSSVVEHVCQPLMLMLQAVTPECLAQFWAYICSNSTFYAPVVGGVVERCLPASGTGLHLTCPVNTTLLSGLLNVGNVLDLANITGNITSTAPAAGVIRDRTYYAACAQQIPRLWPDFNNNINNNSLLFDSLLAFATDVPQECLRIALQYLAVCYDDLTYETGCCSLRCRAAVEKVPLNCFAGYLQSLCTRIPALSRFFFNAAQRCAGIVLTCGQGIVGASNFVAGGAGLPLVASTTGKCPLTQTAWPGFNALRVSSQVIKLLSDASSSCKQQIAKMASNCLQELGIQAGCCSYECAIAMRSVPDPCHTEFRTLLCPSEEDARYFRAMADRCLGTGHYDCVNRTSTG